VTREIERIEIVEDRTSESRCDEGFLRMRRLVLRNHYAGGATSRTYHYDVVSRKHVDAVAIVIYERGGSERVRVALRESLRPPVWLRDEKGLPHGEREHRLLAEIVAGVLEEEDAHEGGVASRAAAECKEEAGYDVDSGDVLPLGTGSFPTPGVTDEYVLFRAVEAELVRRGEALGDGSVTEEAGQVVLLPLRDAIRRCRTGKIADMKTEIGLLRLCDLVGYVPALDLFLDELPEELRERARSLPPLL